MITDQRAVSDGSIGCTSRQVSDALIAIKDLAQKSGFYNYMLGIAERPMTDAIARGWTGHRLNRGEVKDAEKLRDKDEYEIAAREANQIQVLLWRMRVTIMVMRFLPLSHTECVKAVLTDRLHYLRAQLFEWDGGEDGINKTD